MDKLYKNFKINFKSYMSVPEDKPNSLPPIRSAQLHAVSAGLASIVDVVSLQPLDVVKTRLQLQQKVIVQDELMYKGVWDAFVKICRQEGTLALWRGVTPPLMTDTPRRAIKFTVFEYLKSKLSKGTSSSQSNVFACTAAGGMVGLFDGFIQTPIEVIRITQIMNRSESLPTLDAIRGIIQRDGLGKRGLFRGVTATMCRNCIFHIMFFGFYTSVKDAMPNSKYPMLDLLRKIAIAASSGWLGSICVAPFDIAKSRMQGTQPVQGEMRYSSTLGTISTIVKEEGFLALYKGLAPQLIRTGLAAGILLVGFDYINAYLTKIHP